MYLKKNKPQSEMTANASKYPQGYFKPKPCKECSTEFPPRAPSHMHCSQSCADRGVTTAYLMRSYKITLACYEKMLEEQKGVCKLCEKEGFKMAKHHKLKLVVDHCHETGTVRGLLCHNCNRGLGLFKDDVESLKRAIDYLNQIETH